MMVRVNELKGVMAKRGLSQRKLAEKLGISPRTLGSRMKRGIFLSNEICAMMEILDIDNPQEIFFTRRVT